MIDVLKLIIKSYICLTFICFLVAKIKNKQLKNILLFSTLNTVIVDLFIYYEISIYFNNNLYTIIHVGLWFYVLSQYLTTMQNKLIGLSYSFLTICYLLSTNIFTTYFSRYFALTSITYIIMFFLLCVKMLEKEDVDFFYSKDFLLIFAPVMYFLGMSFIFGFTDRMFSEVFVISDVNIYGFINFIVNMIYYSLINYYIYKSKKYV